MRDSPLTSHGVLQARRLAEHLTSRETRITRIFASDLERAARTAEELRNACGDPALEVEHVPALRERDFGPWEGKKFGARIEGEDEIRLSGAETRAAMAERVRAFADALETVGEQTGWDGCVAVVAHGIILNYLARALVSRFPGGNVSLVSAEGMQWGDHTVPFRNTGYFEAVIRLPSETSLEGKPQLDVLGVNCMHHLQGLRKTRGGIGSATFDDKQKTLDGFFKASPSKKDPADGPA